MPSPDSLRGAVARGRAAAGRAVRAARTPAPEPAPASPPLPPPPVPDGALITNLADRSVALEERLTAHDRLFQEFVALLSADEERALLEAVDDEMRERLMASDPDDRRAVLIAVGVARDLHGLRERTGLRAELPPADVHAMSHVEWAAGGDPWYADMIDGALRECGVPIERGTRILDFGCSSGRVVRMLAARRPQAIWMGCDVNADAISWARDHLPDIEWFDQPLRPPLPLGDGSLDAAFAISIWSHYAEAPARTWLDELHRVVRPGGLAMITTHGPGAVAYRAGDPHHGEQAQRGVLVDLYRSGFSFVDCFGDEGDWGVVDREWGVSFMTPEWLLAQITPKWSVALYRPAAIDRHQDLWVLRREA